MEVGLCLFFSSVHLLSIAFQVPNSSPAWKFIALERPNLMDTAGNKLRQYSNKDENDFEDEDLYYGDKDILFFVLCFLL